jgi:hypothetical protein
MTGFPTLTARLTQNMELGCTKNIYGESGLYTRKEQKFNRAELRHGQLTRFPTNYHGLYVRVFNFYDPTQLFMAGMILNQEELRTVNLSYKDNFSLNEHHFNVKKKILCFG